MKKLMIFAAFIAVIILLVILPFAGFQLLDNTIYDAHLSRSTQGQQLSVEGAAIPLAKSMYNRVNIYGNRFLSWVPSSHTAKEGLDIFSQKLYSLYDAGLISHDDIAAFQELVANESYEIVINTDAMEYSQIFLTVFGKINAAMEIESATGKVYSFNFPLAQAQACSVNTVIEYLQIDALTDWQYFNNEAIAYSPKGQLYVYIQQQDNYNLQFGVLHINQDEFADLDTYLKRK